MNRSLRVIIAAGTLLVAGSTWAQQSQNAVSDRPKSDAGDVSYSGIESPAAEEKSDLDAQNACGCNDGENHSCCDDCFSSDGCCPLWTVNAGAVILQRSRPHPAELADVGSTDPINARDFPFSWEAGPDISVIHSIDDGYAAIEFRFFGVSAWSAMESFSGGYTLTTNPPFFLFDPTITYTSRLYSTEINWRQTASDRLTWLAGFRWLQVNENLNFTPTGGGDLVFDTNNNLFGGQIGADLGLWDHGGPFRVESVLKAGIYGNCADNAFHSIGSTSRLLAADQAGQVAFVGEIGLTGVYQLADHIALRGGYQLLWIDGLALASDQVGITNVPLGVVGSGIDSSGNAFYQGVLVSLDFTW